MGLITGGFDFHRTDFVLSGQQEIDCVIMLCLFVQEGVVLELVAIGGQDLGGYVLVQISQIDAERIA